jgi:hypothetical protein
MSSAAFGFGTVLPCAEHLGSSGTTDRSQNRLVFPKHYAGESMPLIIRKAGSRKPAALGTVCQGAPVVKDNFGRRPFSWIHFSTFFLSFPGCQKVYLLTARDFRVRLRKDSRIYEKKERFYSLFLKTSCSICGIVVKLKKIACILTAVKRYTF